MDLPAPPPAGAPKAAWAAWGADVGRLTRAFKVFPCCADDGRLGDDGKPLAKRPRIAGWQPAASWDRKTVEAMWQTYPDSNPAWAIQPGAVALDADIYKPGNEALLDAFEAEYGELPRTLECNSAQGGLHFIYSTPRLFGNGLGNLPRFGDVRGAGGYIVGPGSTFEGKPYTVERLAFPSPLPAHIEARLQERVRAEPGERDLPAGVALDDPLNVARFTTWLLRDAKLSVSGQGGNNTLAATAAMGASYGLSHDTTLHLLLEHWNDRCDPPWEPEDIEKHGGSGYRSASSRFGNMALPSAQSLGFRPVEGDAATDPDDIWRTMADIAGPAPPRQWAWGTDADGWIPLGDLTFLYGPGAAGKTTLLGQMALAFARGEPLFGSPVRQMPVLLVACEDPEDEIHRRFEAQGRQPGDAAAFASLVGRQTALHPSFRPGAPLDDTWLYRALDHRLATMPAGPKLLILDNLSHVYQADYYDPAQITRFLNEYLRRLAKPHDVTVIVAAHPSEAQRASGDGGFGGVQWSTGIRTRLYFDRHMTKPLKRGDKAQPIGRQRVLSRKKANYAADDGASLTLDWDNWKFRRVDQPKTAAALGFRPVEGAAALPGEAVLVEAVEEVLARTRENMSSRQLAMDVSHHLGTNGHQVSVATVRLRVLPRLIEAGHPAYRALEGRGKWRYATQ